jgi:hypothetical protein
MIYFSRKFVLLFVVTACIGFSAQAITIRGTVEKVILTCGAGGECVLYLKQTDGGQSVAIILNEGDRAPTCELNPFAVGKAYQLQPGQLVDVYINDQYKKTPSFYYLCGADATVNYVR